MKTFDQKWGLPILAGVILFIGSFIALPVSSGADEYDDDSSASGFYGSYYEGMSESIYEENGIDPDVEPNWDNIFGKTGKDNGKNLYLLIYNEVKNNPSSVALDNTADYFGYTKDKMINIIDGDLYAMYDFDRTAAKFAWGENTESDLQSLEGLTSTYYDIIAYYENQFAISSFYGELSSTVASQEIFANGTTEDSGFDLIVDLQNIEEILFFGKNEEGYGSGMGPWDDGEEDAGYYLSDLTEFVSAEVSDEEEESEYLPTETSDESAVSESEAVPATEGEETASDTSFECFEDNTLSDELADALSAASSDGTDSQSGSDDEDYSYDEETDINGEDSGNGDDEADSGDNDTDSIQAPEAADWSFDLPCTEVLCIEVNFVSESDESEETEMDEYSDCIYCHISYIEKMLENLTSHDLAGSKVTGNALEDATCKEDSLKIVPNMHVFAIGSPILTPPNDDMIVDVGSFKDDFLSALFPDYEGGGGEYTTADEILLRLQNAGQTESIVELSELVTEMTYEEAGRQMEAMNNFALSSQMSNMSIMYQAVSSEMQQMNDFFYGIESIITGDDDGFVYYLTNILNKPYKN